METTSTTAASSTTATNSTGGSTTTDRLDELNTDAFLQLLIAELQNQDPMEPMDSSEIVQQVSQIRSIESNDDMIETFETAQRGQNMATAAGLLGQKIVALTDDSNIVSGTVDRVTIEDDGPRVHVGDSSISLGNISEIYGDASESTETSE